MSGHLTFVPFVDSVAPTLAELQAGIRLAVCEWFEVGTVSESTDILDRIDETLHFTDAQRSTGEPWPYESF